MPAPKPSYGTKDLERAERQAQFQAQVLQGIADLRADVSAVTTMLERFDQQIRTLQTNDIARETAMLNLTASVKRDFDNVFLRLRSVEDKSAVIDIEKMRKWNDDGVPILRFTKWAGALVVGNIILSAYLAIKSLFP